MIRKIAISLVLLVSLSGCLGAMQKAAAPLPAETQMELQNTGLTLGAPIYVRVFKREAQMEVWMAGPKGDYKLFRTYDVCNWSGDLGPKVKEGDKILLVEAMKTFNPVTAPRAGKVTQILVDNQQPVEFGEPLVIIE